jgi:hypothetical protein
VPAGISGLVFIAPSAGTLRRVLIALDTDELDRAVGACLREHADCDADGWAIALDGKDLRGSWNDDGRLVLFSAMTHRTKRQDAVVLGQITVPEGTTETTQDQPLDHLDHPHRPHGLGAHRPAARHPLGGHPPRRRRPGRTAAQQGDRVRGHQPPT